MRLSYIHMGAFQSSFRLSLPQQRSSLEDIFLSAQNVILLKSNIYKTNIQVSLFRKKCLFLSQIQVKVMGYQITAFHFSQHYATICSPWLHIQKWFVLCLRTVPTTCIFCCARQSAQQPACQEQPPLTQQHTGFKDTFQPSL